MPDSGRLTFQSSPSTLTPQSKRLLGSTPLHKGKCLGKSKRGPGHRGGQGIEASVSSLVAKHFWLYDPDVP
jgi:hypothetical protein